MSSPSTPKRKRASSVSNGVDDNNTSPRKTRAPRGSPTKAQEQKAIAAAKAQRKAEWATWCSQHVWTPDPAYRQKNGGVEMHRSDGMGTSTDSTLNIDRNPAMQYYRLKAEEMATLPYITFENQYHADAPPGKSYVVAELDRLVYRKFATLHGIQVPTNSESETEFLKEGRKLFDEECVCYLFLAHLFSCCSQYGET
jgi:hypothetical protein